MMSVERAQKNAEKMYVSIFHFARLRKDFLQDGNDLDLI